MKEKPLYTLRELRERKRDTQENIAKLLRINRLTYSKKEKGVKELTLAEAIRIAKYYDVSLDELYQDHKEYEGA